MGLRSQQRCLSKHYQELTQQKWFKARVPKKRHSKAENVLGESFGSDEVISFFLKKY